MDINGSKEMKSIQNLQIMLCVPPVKETYQYIYIYIEASIVDYLLQNGVPFWSQIHKKKTKKTHHHRLSPSTSKSNLRT